MPEEHAKKNWIDRLQSHVNLPPAIRPRWWHFALNALIVVGEVPFLFFYSTLRDTNSPPMGILMVLHLFFVAAYSRIIMPFSLLHEVWNWLRSRSIHGAVWLLRPALLSMIVLITMMPLMKWGMIWNFERNLDKNMRIVEYVRNSDSVNSKEKYKRIDIPETLYNGKTVSVNYDAKDDSTYISLYSPGATYKYYISLAPPWRADMDVRYDDHWLLEDGGLK